MDSIQTTSNIIFLEFVWKGSTYSFFSQIFVVLWLLPPCTPKIHLRNWSLSVPFLRWERCQGRNSAVTVLLRYHWHLSGEDLSTTAATLLRKLSASRRAAWCSAPSVQHCDVTLSVTVTGSRGHSCPTATLAVTVLLHLFALHNFLQIPDSSGISPRWLFTTYQRRRALSLFALLNNLFFQERVG